MWKRKRLKEIELKIHLAEKWIEISWKTWAVLLRTGEQESVPLWGSFQTSVRVLASSQPSHPEDQCPKQQRGTCSTDRCQGSREFPKTDTLLEKLLGTVRNLSILPLRAPSSSWWGTGSALPSASASPGGGTSIWGWAQLCKAKLPKWWHQQGAACQAFAAEPARGFAQGRQRGSQDIQGTEWMWQQRGKHCPSRRSTLVLCVQLLPCPGHQGLLAGSDNLHLPPQSRWQPAPCWASGVSDLLSCTATRETQTFTAVVTSFFRVLFPLSPKSRRGLRKVSWRGLLGALLGCARLQSCTRALLPGAGASTADHQPCLLHPTPVRGDFA